MTPRFAERLIASAAAFFWRMAIGPLSRTDRTAGMAAIAPVGCEDVLIKMAGADRLGMTRRRLPGIGNGHRRRAATRDRP